MAEKKTVKSEKIESGQVDLKEILGDIKNVVSGEKEALFKVSKYKIIELKKENLVKSGKENDLTNLNSFTDGKLERLIRSIVKDEISRFQRGQKTEKVTAKNKKPKKTVTNSLQPEDKVKSISALKKMTKKELEDYGRLFEYEVDRRLTKEKIINQVKSLK